MDQLNSTEDRINVYIMGKKVGTAAKLLNEDWLRVGYYDFLSNTPNLSSSDYISVNYLSGEISYFQRETVH